MTREERIKFNGLVAAIEAMSERMDKIEMPSVYNCIDEIPPHAQKGVQYCIEHGIITAAENGLGLDEKDLKYCSVIMRIMEMIYRIRA